MWVNPRVGWSRASPGGPTRVSLSLSLSLFSVFSFFPFTARMHPAPVSRFFIHAVNRACSDVTRLREPVFAIVGVIYRRRRPRE
jgi:hypothetical protein